MELGLYTFGDIGTSRATGLKVTAAERIPQLVEEIVLADQVGLDVFGLGEHHRPDYAVSVPAMVLAGAATRTRRRCSRTRPATGWPRSATPTTGKWRSR